MVEDDVYGFLVGRRATPYCQLARDTNYLTSLSQSIAPGPTAGFMSVPPRLHNASGHAGDDDHGAPGAAGTRRPNNQQRCWARQLSSRWRRHDAEATREELRPICTAIAE
jgi:hypothetical protein